MVVQVMRPRSHRKRSRGQAKRADGKPECGELYRGGARLSGPIHPWFSLFAQKNSEVGSADLAVKVTACWLPHCAWCPPVGIGPIYWESEARTLLVLASRW